MIVKIEGPIATFAKWKAMVHSNAEKIKKYGMTFLYAGTEKDNDSKITTIIRFDTMEMFCWWKGKDEQAIINQLGQMNDFFTPHKFVECTDQVMDYNA